MIPVATTIFVITLITLLFTSVFFYGFRRSGPWDSFWTFLVVLFLGLMFASVWIDPIGPLWSYVAWVDLLVFGLFLALLLAAAGPSRPRRLRSTEPVPRTEGPPPGSAAIAIGAFFWTLIAFAALVALGMMLWAANSGGPDVVNY